MDCRRCDWLLCKRCCPRGGPSPSLWGALSQLPSYAADRVGRAFDGVDAAFDEFAERHSGAIEAIENSVSAVADKVKGITGTSFVAEAAPPPARDGFFCMAEGVQRKVRPRCRLVYATDAGCSVVDEDGA